MRRITFVFIGLLSIALAAWADDPWKQKSDQEWDEGDLRRIMNDSLLGKNVIISSASAPTQPGGPPPGVPAQMGG